MAWPFTTPPPPPLGLRRGTIWAESMLYDQSQIVKAM